MYHPHSNDMIKMLYFSNIEPRGCIYNENKRGSNIEPWGIPHVKRAGEEVSFPVVTENVLSFRQDANHRNTGPFKPTSLSRRSKRMTWSIMSNVAVTSSRTRMAQKPVSTERSRSL